MKTKITIFICSFLMLSACNKAPETDMVVKQMLANNPRYQIIFGRHARADTFLIDNKKGKVWQVSEFTRLEAQPTVWESMMIIDHSDKEIGISYEEFRRPFLPVKSRK